MEEKKRRLELSSYRTPDNHTLMVIGKTTLIFDQRGQYMGIARGQERYAISPSHLEGWHQVYEKEELDIHLTEFLVAEVQEFLQGVFHE